VNLRSFPSKMYHLSHRFIAGLLGGDIVAQEKIGGIQISFGVLEGELCCRSRGVGIELISPPALFSPAEVTVRADEGCLVDGWTDRGEALCKAKRDTLAFARPTIAISHGTSPGRTFGCPPALPYERRQWQTPGRSE
jgi:hypothetical protein